MLLGHGGNISKLSSRRVIDFSSNINPLGITLKIRNIIAKSAGVVTRYPDPECSLAREALAGFLRINKNNILIGNGSNELIHLVPRALNCHNALIYQPAFSEYESSARLAGAKLQILFAKESDDFRIDLKKVRDYIPRVDLIILCNPNNPTGFLLKKSGLLKLAKACENNKTYLLVDETFIEFTEGDNSLIKETSRFKYLMVLRSLTKSFCLPGLRIGYLVADNGLIRKIGLFQPTWSVNAIAQQLIAEGILDSHFIKKTRDYVAKEKQSLFEKLEEIEGIHPYYPQANFIFCKILGKRINAKSLFRRLIKSGILIRDCSNFKGLDNRFFRVAVRKRLDNLYLVSCLKKIFR
ncbi:MAG: threonine-phosphate decarboxylase CobD [Candidatus Omnitrophica bacterium]|nr:threonine-phosphate decarboxylase CobD [Candidatus Omnitrophota bacterium]